MYQAAILIASDQGYAGTREDLCTPYLKELLKEQGYEVVDCRILPDEQQQLEKAMKDICDNIKPQLLLTSGGTGLSPRDCMPEATVAIAQRMVPGIAEAMRAYSMQFTKRAMFSRAVAATRKQTLIINLPGSPKAVKECMEAIIEELPHALGIMMNIERNCARK